MPDTNLPQSRFFDQKYKSASFTAFNNTDFLQVMALTTKVVTDDVIGGQTTDFSVMYTSIDAD